MGYRSGIMLLVLLVCAAGVITAYRYFKFMDEDPAYCSLCHIIEEGYNTHEKSSHYLIICQECHRLSVLEGNKLLMSRYIKGARNIKQDHGRKTPWESCAVCHVSATTKGTITLRESYGHARHVFMQNLTCNKCHVGAEHEFTVDHAKCQNCHADKMVHGMGTAGTYCLNCHNFIEPTTTLVSVERCFNCHSDISTSGVMGHIKCYDCHSPHKKLKLESKDCLGSCHGNETRVGQHGLHLQKTKMECLDCHKPHKWVVGKKEARDLCSRCHRLKDPQTFIY